MALACARPIASIFAASALPSASTAAARPDAFLPQLFLLRFGQRDQRRSSSFGFEDRRLLRRLRAHHRGQTIGLRGLDHRRLELLLPAQNFLLLDRDQLLRPRPLDFDFLGDDRLPRGRLRQRAGLLGARLLRLDLGLVLRLADHEVALRLRDLGVGDELRLLPFLQRLRRLDLRIAMRLGLADRGVALDFGRPPLAERVEVLLFVARSPESSARRRRCPSSRDRWPPRWSASARSSDGRCSLPRRSTCRGSIAGVLRASGR